MSSPEEVGLPKRLFGWKAIGAAVERSPAWAKRWGAQGRPRRLPVVWIAGTPSVRIDHFLEWMESWNGEAPERVNSAHRDTNGSM